MLLILHAPRRCFRGGTVDSGPYRVPLTPGGAQAVCRWRRWLIGARREGA